VKKIRVLTIRFKNLIYKEEIPLLRGAVINAIENEDSILFHNHDGEKMRYKYPLIQYKRINQKAAIVCVEEGTDAIGHFFGKQQYTFTLGERKIEMEVENINADYFLIQTWDVSFTYNLRKWIPLNQDNYKEYIKLEGISEKCTFLEKILIGNILSFAKGIQYTVEKEIFVKIVQLEEPVVIKYKGVKMLCFDLIFKSNISLPNYIGLGKGVSVNYGTISRINNNSNA